MTFVQSLLERVIEEQERGDTAKAEAIRTQVTRIIGDNLASVKPGSREADEIKRVREFPFPVVPVPCLASTFLIEADILVIGDRHDLRRRRNDERNRFVAALAIDGEISVQRTDMVVVVLFAHAHQAGVGERHRHIRILSP